MAGANCSIIFVSAQLKLFVFMIFATSTRVPSSLLLSCSMIRSAMTLSKRLMLESKTANKPTLNHLFIGVPVSAMTQCLFG